jgi:hypothetical protein
MSGEQVALIPRCAGCLDVWLPDVNRDPVAKTRSERVFVCVYGLGGRNRLGAPALGVGH